MSSPFDPRMTAYFGDAVLRAGFMPTPHLFMRHYVDLGLDSTLAMFILQIMETAWDLGAPPKTSRDFARRMGVGTKAIQRYTNRVEELGLVQVFTQFDDSGAQIENCYDLSPLFARLAQLAPEPPPEGERRRVPRRPAAAPRRPGEQQPDQPVPTNAASVSPPPGRKSPAPPRQNCTGGVDQTRTSEVDHPIQGAAIKRSGLKGNPRIAKKQQESMIHAATVSDGANQKAVGAAPNRASQPPGWSLRQQRPLTDEEIATGERILARMAIDNPLRALIAAATAPGDIWALRLYSAAKGWSPALTVSQVYDKRHKQVHQPPDLHMQHYAAGEFLAALAPETAEATLDLVLRTCPDAPHQLRAAPLLVEADPAISAAVNAAWRLVAELRGRPSAILAVGGSEAALTSRPLTAEPSTGERLWQSALCEIQRRIAPGEFATWFASTGLLEVIEEAARTQVVVGVPNIFVRDYLRATYQPVLEQALSDILGGSIKVEIELDHRSVLPPHPAWLLTGAPA